MYKSHFFRGARLVVVTVLSGLVSVNANPLWAGFDTPETEAILVKHLNSIGLAEDRKSVNSIMITGTAKVIARGRNSGETSGIVVLASTGDKNLVGMKFPNNDYPQEIMGFDGEDVTVSYLSPGMRSILGGFLYTNRQTFKHGLLGGVLSTGWEFLDYNENKGKLKCGRTKTIRQVKHYKCSYQPKKSELDIDLYFRSDNFRHSRTVYKQVISAAQGTSIDNSAHQQETRFTLTEDFSQFKTVGKLTFPNKYDLSFEVTSGQGSISMEWDIRLNKFTFNEVLDPKSFKVDSF